MSIIFANYLSDPATYSMESIVFFFRDTMVFVYAIGFFVFWIIFRCMIIFNESNTNLEFFSKYSKGYYYFNKLHYYASGMKHFTVLEIVWTIIPALILIIIGIPSFSLLYFIEEFTDPELILRVEGHQWYWHYQLKGSSPCFPDEDTSFDSYMVPSDSLKLGQLRLLEVDKKVILPINTHIQMVGTSVDVIHCWTVPSLGFKVDCCPGRLNESMFYIRRIGVFYGQCSEICGMNHAFMPIAVRAATPIDFVLFNEFGIHN